MLFSHIIPDCYSNSGWKLVKDCRYVFPAITEVARATAIKNGGAIKGTELSLGVHSYNDSRRADESTEDNLDIQGGKHLKLNVGFWQDELDGEGSLPPNDDRVEGMDFCVSDRPRMKLDQYGRLGIGPGDDGSGTKEPEAWLDLQPKWGAAEPPAASGDGKYIGLHINPTFPVVDESKKYALKVENGHVDIGDRVSISGDLTVAGKSHLQNIVSIGAEAPQADGEETIGLNVKPDLTVPANASEVVGLNLEPTLNASNDNDKLTGLHINPQFKTSCCNVQKYGLIVEKGKVGIGSVLNNASNTNIGVEVRSCLTASNKGDKLVGLYIQPNFHDNGKNPVESYGLIVENGKVAIGSPGDTGYPVETDGQNSKVENLEVKGNLNVEGNVTYKGNVTAYAVETNQGRIELGDDDRDRVVVHATMSSKHTSGKLKLTSPLEIQLEDKDIDRDFLSLFSTNTNPTQGRIVWKKGQVEKEGGNVNNTPEEYKENSKVIAAIYSDLNGNGGNLKFGTASDDDTPLVDRMVITAEGNVGIGTAQPAGNKLKVTDKTELQDLKVLGGATIDGSTTMNTLTLSGAGSASAPTLAVTQGNVCIGAPPTPGDYKLYVTGGETHLDGKLTVATGDVAIASGNTTVGGTLTVTGAGTFNNQLDVTGNTTVGGTLTVTGAGTFNNQLDVTGNTTVGGTLTVTGAGTFNNQLDVTGNTTVGGTLTVTGAGTFNNQLDVTGNTTVGGTLTVTGAGTFNNQLDVTGNTTVGGTLTVTGAGTFNNQLDVTGNTTVGGTLTVTGAGTFNDQLDVTGNTTVGGTLTVTGAGTFNDQLDVTGDVAIASGNLTLTDGTTSLGGALTVASGGVTLTEGDVTLTNGNLALAQGSLAIGNITPGAPLHVYKYDDERGSEENNLVEIARFERGCHDASDNETEAEGGFIGLYLNDDNTPHKEVARISWRYDNNPNNEVSGRLGFWTSHDANNDADDPGYELLERMTITKDGNVGIGKVPASGIKLDVNGNIKSHSLTESSDVKLKENIHTLKDGLAKILGLRGVSYQWKDDKKAAQETHIGLVAQEVEGIFPELVSTDSQGMKSLSYSKLIAPLIEAIKEQQGQILELVNQVQQQQAQIGQLQALKNG